MFAVGFDRIAAIDGALRDERAWYFNYASPHTLLEFDVAIWTPANVLTPYRVRDQFHGDPALSERASFNLSAATERRSEDVAHFLRLGRTLVVHAPPPLRWWVITGEEISGTGRNARTQEVLSPMEMADILPFPYEARAATGIDIDLATDGAFRTFWEATRDLFYYQARLVPPVGHTLLTIAETTHPIGSILRVESGTVLLIPTLFQIETVDESQIADYIEADQRELRAAIEKERTAHARFLDGLLEFVSSLQLPSEHDLPDWADRFFLPTEAKHEAGHRAAQRRVSAAQRAAEARFEELLQVRRRKLLLTTSGNALEALVEEALELLGATVEPGRPGRTDRIVRWKGKAAVVEIKGVTKSARESHAAQLEKWVSEYIADHGSAPKAILIVNAWRNQPLHQRNAASFPDQMLPYSKARSHSLITTSQLLAATLVARSKARREAFLDALFDTIGVLPGYDLMAVIEPRAEPASTRTLEGSLPGNNPSESPGT